MTYRKPRGYRPEKPGKEQIARTMLAITATPEAQARVGDFTERVLGVPATAADPAPKRGTANRNRLRGLAVEGHYGGKGASAVLTREGYRVARSQDSKGAADVWAVKADPAAPGPVARLVQVKRVGAYAPAALNDAVRRFLGLGTWARAGAFGVAIGVSREAWLWVDGEGWAARLWLGADGAVTRCDGPRGEQTAAAVRTMLARPAPVPAPAALVPPRGSDAAFRARLEGGA